jgi:hypothetical protein
MPDHLFRTLKIIRHLKRASATEVLSEGYKRVLFGPVVVGAINNRLAELRRLGFLTRKLEGRTWIYSVK